MRWANKKCNNFNIYSVVFFKKNKEKHLEISLFHTCVPKILMIWSTVPEIYSATDWNWSLWVIFCFFTSPSPKNPKNQNFEKMKKIAGDIIILHMSTKNHNHMRYGSRDTEWGRHNFCHFSHLPYKKHLETLSFYTCVP